MIEERSVIIKALCISNQQGKFKHEYDLLCCCCCCNNDNDSNNNPIIKAIEYIEGYQLLESYTICAAIVMEDVSGVALSNTIPTNGFSVTQYLRIAIQLTEGLSSIHRHDVIHRDIKPDNIIVTSDGTIKYIDFGSASGQREHSKIQSELIGTLGYISPEQTGRMNIPVDYRTDFYSLGVTLYQLLCGVLPFDGMDARSLVYSHIAKEPISPYELKQHSIPIILSDIIMKLLKKNPDDRYQSSQGLLFDLRTCMDRLSSSNDIETFSIGKHDVSERFLIPMKLYGRLNEVQLLSDAYMRVKRNGSTEIVVVSGSPGLGKSALINEIRKPVIAEQGFFLVGKFDQYQHQAYGAIVEAFRDLAKQILGEGEQRIKYWKDEILQYIGKNGQVLIDVIPEFESILGEQPSVSDIGIVESRNRFTMVFQKLMRAITRNTPVVLFLGMYFYGWTLC
jgi:serine/threonine protein kinase